jgi:membrane protease YdiL (CAAX protease family)
VSVYDALTQVVVAALVAVALWQKASDRLPYLLEPTESAPPRLSVADGLIAVLAFLTLQTLVRGLLTVSTELSLGMQLLVGTGVAGVVTTLAALWFLRRVPGLLVATGLRAGRDNAMSLLRSLRPGVLAGLAAGVFGAAYLALLEAVPALRAWRDSWSVGAPMHDAGLFVWVVLAAPVFEEFVFRGLLFQGLRRSVAPWLAVVVSAALFTAVHPALSALPVFVLGIAAALSFRRTGLLQTSIAAHVVYNFIVVLAEWQLRG